MEGKANQYMVVSYADQVFWVRKQDFGIARRSADGSGKTVQLYWPPADPKKLRDYGRGKGDMTANVCQLVPLLEQPKHETAPRQSRSR